MAFPFRAKPAAPLEWFSLMLDSNLFSCPHLLLKNGPSCLVPKSWLKIIEKRIFKWPGPYILQKAWPSYVSHQGKNDQKNKLFSTYLPKVDSAGLVRVLIMSYSQRCPPHPHLEPVRSRADPVDSCGGLSWTNNRCFPLRCQERTRAPLDSHLWVSHSPLQPLRGLARPTSPPWSVQAPVPDTNSQHWPRTSTRWLWPGVFPS